MAGDRSWEMVQGGVLGAPDRGGRTEAGMCGTSELAELRFEQSGFQTLKLSHLEGMSFLRSQILGGGCFAFEVWTMGR